MSLTEKSAREQTERELLAKRFGKVIEDDFDHPLTAELPDETEAKNWRKIKELAAKKTVLERTVKYINPCPSGVNDIFIVVDVCGFPVYIRRDDFFYPGTLDDYAGTVSESERATRANNLAQFVIGANIPIVITQVLEEKDAQGTARMVLGSRLQAMERKREFYFFSGEYPPILENTVVKTRIVRATKSGVFAEALGVETFIPNKDLSAIQWVYPPTDFPAGTVSYAVMKNIEKDFDAKTISFALSIADVDRPRAKKVLQSVVPGSRHMGSVVGVGPKTYFIQLSGLNVKAQCSKEMHRGAPLYRNDRVFFTANKVDEEHSCVIGYCTLIPRKNY